MIRSLVGLSVACLLVGPSVAWLPGGGALAAAELPKYPRNDVKRVLPPPGIDLTPQDRKALDAELKSLREELDLLAPKLADKPALVKLLPDVEMLLAAVKNAVELEEFYQPPEVAQAKNLLGEAKARLEHLRKGNAPWTKATGTVVRGYRSVLDDSVQPFGLVIPENLDLNRPVPLYVWLRGRGEKLLETQFLSQRMKSPGEIKPDNAIVLHPFGRYCNANKLAGEVDIFEAIDRVKQEYKIDEDRIALVGFSMGGAGVWQAGGHYTERWCAVAPGAGFSETKLFTNLKPEQYPPEYGQKLWGIYDMPCYVRNLFNVRVMAYSGEQDKQIQAARVMEAAYEQEGRKLDHLIGPKTAHKYHPDSLKQLHKFLAEAVSVGRERYPLELHLQTRTLRYAKLHWAELLGLKRHWEDSRLDASVDVRTAMEITTRNVTVFRLTPWDGDTRRFGKEITLKVDGQKVDMPADLAGRSAFTVALKDDRWTVLAPTESLPQLSKRPGLQGPIDDAWLSPYLLVLPSGAAADAAIETWTKKEIGHTLDRHRRIFRGEIRTKLDKDVTQADLERYNVVCFGDPETNSVLKKIADKLPVRWAGESLALGPQTFDRKTHVPLFVYPNPAAPERYVVVNSGLTFREAEDANNAKQIPRLPDWAAVDVTVPADGVQPGKVAAAGFFDERWQWPQADR